LVLLLGLVFISFHNRVRCTACLNVNTTHPFPPFSSPPLSPRLLCPPFSLPTPGLLFNYLSLSHSLSSPPPARWCGCVPGPWAWPTRGQTLSRPRGFWTPVCVGGGGVLCVCQREREKEGLCLGVWRGFGEHVEGRSLFSLHHHHHHRPRHAWSIRSCSGPQSTTHTYTYQKNTQHQIQPTHTISSFFWQPSSLFPPTRSPSPRIGARWRTLRARAWAPSPRATRRPRCSPVDLRWRCPPVRCVCVWC
jgi:hypothetical protein